MPELNQLSCSIELGRTNTKLTEYNTTYNDKRVSSFICVPDYGIDFSIHLTSNGYIAPGLAMFVFIDGRYQVNRNKTDLAIPEDDTTAEVCGIDFRVRQKEEQQSDGTLFIGRDWTFSKLKIGLGPLAIGAIIH